MSGAHFRDYHRLLDEQAAEIFALIDPRARVDCRSFGRLRPGAPPSQAPGRRKAQTL